MLNILLVDDDPDDHLLFSEAIASLEVKYTIIPVNDGIEALDYLQKGLGPVQSVLPHFIVLDLNMPRKDGFTVLKEIKANDKLKNTPVYILTTSLIEAHVNRCRDLGAAGYFTKPSKLSELKASINKMIIDLQ